jgi:hypothetical protein
MYKWRADLMVEGWGGMWRQRREQSSIEARKWQLGKVAKK